MKRLPIFIFFIFLFLFLLPKTVQATVLLWDDFNDGNANDNIPVDWDEFAGPQGNWHVQSGEYVGTVVKDCGADMFSYALAGNSSWGNYSFSTKIMGTQGVDKKIMFRYQSVNTRYDINLLNGGSMALQKWINGSSVALWWGSFNTTSNQWYDLRVEAIGINIKVFIENQKVIDIIDGTNPILTGRIGLQVWPGYYIGCGGRTTTRFDDVLVCDFDGPCEIPTPTPTPTPTFTPLQPLIFLPGMGASWNHEAMILGQKKEPEDWYMTPGVKVYDGLIQTFQNAGYILGENFFVFNYDWRKPVEEIAQDLKNFISLHPPPLGTEIDLVGHSFGGLLARTYVQENQDNQVDQLITVGSPHQGVVKSYYLWEGAELSRGLSGWQRIAAGIILQLHKKAYENNVQAIQAEVPSLNDLLPTFPYLKKDGIPKPLIQMNARNLWLENLNDPVPNPLLQKLNTIMGINENTLRWIDVKNRNRFDQLLGKWVDGKPIGKEDSMGDNTVLEFSASLDGAANKIQLLNLDHGDLVEKIEGQQAIVNLLGLSPSSITSAPVISYEPSLVFQLASQANMTIYGPDGWQIGEGVTNTIPNATYSPDDKLIILPEPLGGNYEIRVTPQGVGGKYRLMVGFITENGDYWEEFTGTVTVDSVNTHELWVPDPNQTPTFILLHQAKNQIFDLKKFFNKEKIPPKLKGQIENELAKIMARINAALDLLEEDKIDKSQEKINQAIKSINSLQDYINSSALPPATKDLLSEPLEELKNLLNQALS